MSEAEILSPSDGSVRRCSNRFSYRSRASKLATAHLVAQDGMHGDAMRANIPSSHSAKPGAAILTRMESASMPTGPDTARFVNAPFNGPVGVDCNSSEISARAVCDESPAKHSACVRSTAQVFAGLATREDASDQVGVSETPFDLARDGAMSVLAGAVPDAARRPSDARAVTCAEPCMARFEPVSLGCACGPVCDETTPFFLVSAGHRHDLEIKGDGIKVKNPLLPTSAGHRHDSGAAWFGLVCGREAAERRVPGMISGYTTGTYDGTA